MRTQQPHINVGSVVDQDGSAESPVTASASRPGRLLAAEDVAELLGVNATFVYALVRRGELPAVRVGERYVRFRAQTLERWIESQETSGWRGCR